MCWLLISLHTCHHETLDRIEYCGHNQTFLHDQAYFFNCRPSGIRSRHLHSKCINCFKGLSEDQYWRNYDRWVVPWAEDVELTRREAERVGEVDRYLKEYEKMLWVRLVMILVLAVAMSLSIWWW